MNIISEVKSVKMLITNVIVGKNNFSVNIFFSFNIMLDLFGRDFKKIETFEISLFSSIKLMIVLKVKLMS